MAGGVNVTRRLGVMGGTFDPIHVGHLIAAEGAREAAGLDEVLFVPAGDPPHKESSQVTPAGHRYMMTLLATVTNPHFSVSRIELDRQGKSFTVDTIEALKAELPPGTEIYFILGSDSMADVPNWHQPQRLLSLCHFLVVGRPGWDRGTVERSLGPLYAPHKERIHAIDIPEVSVSSSDIRARVRAGRSIRYLTTDLVVQYIEDRGLYKGEPGKQGLGSPGVDARDEGDPGQGEPVAAQDQRTISEGGRG